MGGAGCGGRQLTFFPEKQEYGLELWDFPAARVAGEGLVQPEAIVATRTNLGKIRRRETDAEVGAAVCGGRSPK